MTTEADKQTEGQQIVARQIHEVRYGGEFTDMSMVEPHFQADRKAFAAAIDQALATARSETWAKAIEIAKDFNAWVWCSCWDCRVSAKAHAINTEASLAQLIAQLEAAATQKEGD